MFETNSITQAVVTDYKQAVSIAVV